MTEVTFVDDYCSVAVAVGEVHSPHLDEYETESEVDFSDNGARSYFTSKSSTVAKSG